MAASRRTKRRQRAAESYPSSEVRGSCLECQAATEGEGPRGATLCPRSGVVAERSHPMSKARGSARAKGGSGKEQPHARGQGSDREQQPHAQG